MPCNVICVQLTLDIADKLILQKMCVRTDSGMVTSTAAAVNATHIDASINNPLAKKNPRRMWAGI